MNFNTIARSIKNTALWRVFRKEIVAACIFVGICRLPRVDIFEQLAAGEERVLAVLAKTSGSMSNSISTLPTSILPFALSYLLLTVVPGPNFLVVTDAGMTSNRRSALFAALGVAAGACLLSAGVATGASGLMTNEIARRGAALLFGGYLIFLALKSWGRARTVRHILHMRCAAPTRGHFRLAFLTAVANPTSALFFASAPPAKSLGWAITASVVFAVAILWFGLVAVVASGRRLETVSERTASVMNVAFGAVFMVLGAVTILSSG